VELAFFVNAVIFVAKELCFAEVCCEAYQKI